MSIGQKDAAAQEVNMRTARLFTMQGSSWAESWGQERGQVLGFLVGS